MKKGKLLRMGIVIVVAIALAGGWLFLQPSPFEPFDSPPGGARVAHAEGAGTGCTACHTSAIVSTSLGCKTCHNDTDNTPASTLNGALTGGPINIMHHTGYFLLNPCNDACNCGGLDACEGTDFSTGTCDCVTSTAKLAACIDCHTDMAVNAAVAMSPVPDHTTCQTAPCHQGQTHG